MKRWIKRAAGITANGISRSYDLFYPAEHVDQSLADRLTQSYRSMSASQQNSEQRIEDEWIKFRQQIREQILEGSPVAFLRRAPMADLLGLGNSASAFGSWRYLRHLTNWARYRAVLKEDSLGRPIRFLCMPSTGGNQIHHTSHLAAFEEKSKARAENIRLVVEFGGGYGSFCRQLHRLGFHGKYIILDLPELSALQQYYLSSLGFNVLPRESWTDPAAEGIVLITDTKELARIVEVLKPALSPSLFVATWSISEVPVQLREEVLHVVNSFDHFLIAYQPEFGSVRNSEFFPKLVAASERPDGWLDYPIPHNPTSHYLIR